jgi:hypothetical protein
MNGYICVRISFRPGLLCLASTVLGRHYRQGKYTI